MTTEYPNVPLLRKALEYITEHPEEHDQSSWARRTPCGTTLCLAGTVAKLTGHDFSWDVFPDLAFSTTTGRLISEVAQDELRIDNVDAHLLFHGCDTVDELWEAAEEITDGEIRRPL